MKINYDSEFYKSDTKKDIREVYGENESTASPVPELGIVDTMHLNTADLKSLERMVNKLYTCLYGNLEPTHASCKVDPTCFAEELKLQRQTIVDIHDVLSHICTKLGM